MRGECNEYAHPLASTVLPYMLCFTSCPQLSISRVIRLGTKQAATGEAKTMVVDKYLVGTLDKTRS